MELKRNTLVVIMVASLVAGISAVSYYYTAKQLTVRVGYMCDSVHQSSYFISKVNDLWSRTGVTVMGFEFFSDTHEIDAFRTGYLDVGFVGVGPTVTTISRGASVRIIASMDSEGSALVVRKDPYENGLKTIENLRGRTPFLIM